MGLLDEVFPFINDLALGPALDAHRAQAARGARGRVLEIGAGTGLNFRHYARGVDLYAIEPSPPMRRRAERRARAAEVTAQVQVAGGSAEALPFEDGAFDAVVVTFVLCSVRDLGAAVREVRRVLRPDGALHVLEHVASPDPATARWQRRIEPIWKRALGGCHLTRDVAGALDEAGFDTGAVQRVTLDLPRLVRAGIAGVARPR